MLFSFRRRFIPRGYAALIGAVLDPYPALRVHIGFIQAFLDGDDYNQAIFRYDILRYWIYWRMDIL
jgi:hypothetical protein